MSKIASIEELMKRKNEAKAKLNIRSAADKENMIVLKIAMGTCGIAAGAKDTFTTLIDEVKKRNIENILVIQTGCMGYCYAEPTVEVSEPGKEPILYGRITKERAAEIIDKHILNGELLQDSIVGKTHENA